MTATCDSQIIRYCVCVTRKEETPFLIEFWFFFYGSFSLLHSCVYGWQAKDSRWHSIEGDTWWLWIHAIGIYHHLTSITQMGSQRCIFHHAEANLLHDFWILQLYSNSEFISFCNCQEVSFFCMAAFCSKFHSYPFSLVDCTRYSLCQIFSRVCFVIV